MNDWESVKKVQALCGRLDLKHIYAQCKLIFISKISRLNNDVMKACFDIFCRSDESMSLHCEFDIYVGAPAGDLRDAVFNNFYAYCYYELNVFVFFVTLYCIVKYCIVLSRHIVIYFLYCIFLCFLPMWRIGLNVFIIIVSASVFYWESL